MTRTINVGIVGFGGLGHVGVKIAHTMGAHTTVLELTDERRADALRMGADAYVITREPGAMDELKDSFDLMVSTVPVNYDLTAHMDLLAFNGTLVNLGVPEKPLSLDPYTLLTNRRTLAGSMSGGMPETQEMLDFCGKHNVTADVEVIPIQKVNEAYERLLKSDVKYRFSIDMASLKSE